MSIYEIYGCSHQGLVRENNEDHFLLGRFIKNNLALSLVVAEDDDYLARFGLLLAVADGMGGLAAGEVASRIALSTLDRHFYATEKQAGDHASHIRQIEAGVQRANDTMLRLGQTDSSTANMGCTLTGVDLTSSGYLVFNAGDSRVCRFRGGYLKQLTTDETLANLLQRLPEESTPEDIDRATHTLTNSLGAATCQLTIQEGPKLIHGDILLICSDGLHGMVSIDKLEELLRQDKSVEEIGQELLHAALAAGGQDNISLIRVRLRKGRREQETLLPVESGQPVEPAGPTESDLQKEPLGTPPVTQESAIPAAEEGLDDGR